MWLSQCTLAHYTTVGVRRVASEGWPRKGGLGRVASEGWPRKGGLGRVASEGWPRKGGLGRVASEGWPRKGGLGRWHFGSMWLHVVITVHTSSLDNSTLSEGGTWEVITVHTISTLS